MKLSEKVNFMAKKTTRNLSLYLVKPEAKPGLVCPVPNDAKPSECQKAYYVRKYMKLHFKKFTSKIPE